MFGRFFQVIVGWWNEYQKENQFVHDTLEELHQKLGVFDQGGDYWTYRGKTYVSVCKGKKFPLYLHWKTACVCTVTLEKKFGQWFLVVEYSHSADKQNNPVDYLDAVVSSIRKYYGV